MHKLKRCGRGHKPGSVPPQLADVKKFISASSEVLIICLGRCSRSASSGQPGDDSEPGKLFLPIGPCTGWGLPSYLCFQRHWCALTAPFHPYPADSIKRPRLTPPIPLGEVGVYPADSVKRGRGGLLSVAPAVALRAQALPGTLPCGARTFLSPTGCPTGRDQVPLTATEDCSMVLGCRDYKEGHVRTQRTL